MKGVDQQDIGIALLSHLERCTGAHRNHLDFIAGLLLKKRDQHIEQTRILRGCGGARIRSGLAGAGSVVGGGGQGALQVRRLMSPNAKTSNRPGSKDRRDFIISFSF